MAGGKSSRMGADKGLVKLNGKNMVEHVISSVMQVTDSIMIVANNSDYGYLGVPVFPDAIKDCGPMGGIYTGLIHSETEKNIVLSCDLPFVTMGVLNDIIKATGECEITVPVHDGRIEPLCGLYKKNCSVIFHSLLLKREFKMLDSLKCFKVQMLDVTKSENYSERMFRNINSTGDLLIAEELFHEN